jgi:hypothetical protein
MLAGHSQRVALLPGVNVDNSNTFRTRTAVFNSARADVPMTYLSYFMLEANVTCPHKSHDMAHCILGNQTPWPESASELYRPSDHRLLAKLVPTFADRGCHVFNVTDPPGRILDFLDRSRYFFFQVASQLYLRG